MRKSIVREYELDRTYDFGDARGFRKTKSNVGLVKRRARRRYRHQNKLTLNRYIHCR